MKKFTMMLAGVAALYAGTAVKAQAPKHDVVLEIATGTWCTYCPGAAMGADDLRAAGAHVAVVKHHDSDPYETPESVARYGSAYYGVTGFPTAFFDGGNSVVGGSHTQSMYPNYNTKYQTAYGTATPYDISASWTQNGANIDISVTVTQMGANTPTNLRLQAALVESHIPEVWQGMSEVNFVNRDMYPDANGQALSLTQGNSQTLTFSMAINPAWDQAEMELAVWVEDGSSKVIFNGMYLSLLTLAAGQDPSVLEVQNPIGPNSCATSVAPVVDMRNLGDVTVTAVTFSYNVNGGTPGTFNWTGSMAPGAHEIVTLPALSFTSAANNTLTVNITSSSDVNGGNNVITDTWTNIASGFGVYTVTITPDNYGSETTWDLKNSGGTTVANGGPYIDNNTTPQIIATTLSTNDCYVLTVHDAYGDGMCCAYGNGGYTLKNPANVTIASGGTFGSTDARNFSVDDATGVSNLLKGDVNVFPNPSHGVFNIELPAVMDAQISVLTLAGKLVHTASTSDALVKMDLSHLAAGMYMVQIQTAEGVAVKKITKE